MIALLMALAATLGPPVAVLEQRHPTVARGRTRRCEPFANRCRGSVVEACEAGRWRAVIDCANHGARCSLEPDGYAVCVHSGGAS